MKLIIAGMISMLAISDNTFPKFELSVYTIIKDKKPEKSVINLSNSNKKIPLLNSRYVCSVSEIEVINFNGLPNYSRRIECKYYNNILHVEPPLTSAELTIVCGNLIQQQGSALTLAEDNRLYHFIFTCKLDVNGRTVPVPSRTNSYIYL